MFASAGAAPTAEATSASTFVLSSPDPQRTRYFPDRYVLNDYGCSGGNESPPLRWSGAPAATLRFVATLPVSPDSSGAMVVSTFDEHSLGKAVLVARFGR